MAENQKNTIDLYLQERVVNLFNLFHSREFSLQPTQEAMDNYLQSLKRFHDGFIDVGFFNARGIQIGYAGPHPQLRGRDYSEQPWFRDLREGSRNYLISDIYTGLRNIPHFTIAVRQVFDGTPYIMRATLDPDKLYVFLRSISHGKEVETTLINTRGQHQVVDPGRGPFPSTSSYVPPTVPAGGVEEIEFDERTTLIAYSWLKETPWALLVMQPVMTALARSIPIPLLEEMVPALVMPAIVAPPPTPIAATLLPDITPAPLLMILRTREELPLMSIAERAASM